MPETKATGRYSSAPAAALATAGVSPAARWRRQHDAGRAGRLGGAHHRAEVLGIGDAVERDEERLRIGEQVVEVGGAEPAPRTRSRPGARRCGPGARSGRPGPAMRTPAVVRQRCELVELGRVASSPSTAGARGPCGGRRRAARAPPAGPPPAVRDRRGLARALARPARPLAPRRAALVRAAPCGRPRRLPAHRCQTVPLGVSSSLMPRAVRSSRSGRRARSPCGAGLVALAHQRVDLGVVVGVLVIAADRRARATPRSSRTVARAPPPRSRLAVRRCAVRVARPRRRRRQRGRRVEVVVHRGTEPRRRVASSSAASSASTPAASAGASARRAARRPWPRRRAPSARAPSARR